MITTDGQAVEVIMSKLGYSRLYEDYRLSSTGERFGRHFWVKGQEKLTDEQALVMCKDLNKMAEIWKDKRFMVRLTSIANTCEIRDLTLNPISYGTGATIQDATFLATARALEAQNGK